MHIRKSPWGLSLYEGERPRWAGFGLGLSADPEDGLIASCLREHVEELADYGGSLARGDELPPDRWWRFKVASGAPRGRWHVIRFLDGPGMSGQNLLTPTGRLKTFGDRASAQRAAEAANVGITAERESMYVA